eukprot:812480-Pyramimonas_sp.AAC.1
MALPRVCVPFRARQGPSSSPKATGSARMALPRAFVPFRARQGASHARPGKESWGYGGFTT